jgi:hypothetical protein
VDQFVRPILRALRQEGVLTPAPPVAMQVLAAGRPIEAEVRADVARLVTELDSPDYRVRLRAVEALIALGPDASAEIAALDRSALSPEQNTRLDEVVVGVRPLPADEAARLRDDPSFLIDCLATDNATVRKLALQRLSEVTGGRIEFDVDADVATRLPAVASLRDRFEAGRKDEEERLRKRIEGRRLGEE